jgi:hypothetical protein
MRVDSQDLLFRITNSVLLYILLLTATYRLQDSPFSSSIPITYHTPSDVFTHSASCVHNEFRGCLDGSAGKLSVEGSERGVWLQFSIEFTEAALMCPYLRSSTVLRLPNSQMSHNRKDTIRPRTTKLTINSTKSPRSTNDASIGYPRLASMRIANGCPGKLCSMPSPLHHRAVRVRGI